MSDKSSAKTSFPVAINLLVFVTSMSILALEVFYTRVFAIIFWKNTAFAILSLAMLGIGASGLMVMLRRPFFAGEKTRTVLCWMAPAYGLSILLSYLWILHLSSKPYDPVASISSFPLLILAAMAPFFFGGAILSIVFTRYGERISRLYFWDLTGAAVGAVATLPVLYWINGPAIIPVLSLLTLATGLLLGLKQRNRLAVLAGTAAVIGVSMALLAQVTVQAMDVTRSRGRDITPDVLHRWDPLGLVTVFRTGPVHLAFWIDGAVPTPIIAFRGNLEEMGFLRHNVLQLVHHFGPYDKTVIIGPGGGSDVLAALVFGNRDIDAVEINRSIVEIMQGPLRKFNGDLYNRKGVDLHVAEGRGWLLRRQDKADLIQITFIDTWTAAVAGSHTLSENYLYTVESIDDYLSRLNDDGFISISRWGGERYGLEETYRTVAIAAAALRQLGVADPGRHLAVVRGPRPDHLVPGTPGYQGTVDMESMATILIRKTPFSSAHLERLATLGAVNEFRPMWIPGIAENDDTVGQILDAGGSAEVFRRYRAAHGVDIGPVLDDRPFFFDFLSPFQGLFEKPKDAWLENVSYNRMIRANGILTQLLVVTVLLVVILIVAPLLFRAGDLRRTGMPVATLGYFATLGVGFIGIELGLIQRFSLFLGHPIYALAVGLAAMLFSSGLGSRSTAKIHELIVRTAARRIALLVGVLAIYGWLLPLVTRALIGLPQAAKFALCAAFIFPPSYLMGMAFPLGIKALPEARKVLIPWLWGLNSGASVLGSIFSLMIALSFGYTVAWYFFTAAYLVAVPCMLRIGPPGGRGPRALQSRTR